MKYLILLLILCGCTDAQWDGIIESYNEVHDVSCYSGGQEIFKAKTTGKVTSLSGGGWAFRTTDNRFVKTFADCFVSFKK